MWDLGHLSVDAGEADVRSALLIRGAGLGMLFTPINNVAYASLKPSEAQQAAGLINLSRQLGGSFGIALLASYVTTHTQIHRADLVSNVYAGNPLVEQRLQAFTANLLAHGYSPDAARQAALGLLDQQVTRQAAMLSYNDAWMLLLLTFLIVSPAILLLRRPKGPGRRGGRALTGGYIAPWRWSVQETATAPAPPGGPMRRPCHAVPTPRARPGRRLQRRHGAGAGRSRRTGTVWRPSSRTWPTSSGDSGATASANALQHAADRPPGGARDADDRHDRRGEPRLARGGRAARLSVDRMRLACDRRPGRG